MLVLNAILVGRHRFLNASCLFCKRLTEIFFRHFSENVSLNVRAVCALKNMRNRFENGCYSIFSLANARQRAQLRVFHCYGNWDLFNRIFLQWNCQETASNNFNSLSLFAFASPWFFPLVRLTFAVLTVIKVKWIRPKSNWERPRTTHRNRWVKQSFLYRIFFVCSVNLSKLLFGLFFFELNFGEQPDQTVAFQGKTRHVLIWFSRLKLAQREKTRRVNSGVLST